MGTLGTRFNVVHAIALVTTTVHLHHYFDKSLCLYVHLFSNVKDSFPNIFFQANVAVAISILDTDKDACIRSFEIAALILPRCQNKQSTIESRFCMCWAIVAPVST